MRLEVDITNLSGPEALADALEGIARKLRNGERPDLAYGEPGKIRDANGNDAGSWMPTDWRSVQSVKSYAEYANTDISGFTIRQDEDGYVLLSEHDAERYFTEG